MRNRKAEQESLLKSEIADIWQTWEQDCAVSFFQTYAWASILSRHYPFLTPAPLINERYLIPLMRMRRYGWLSDSLYGMPLMTPGGILSRQPLTPDVWQMITQQISHQRVGSVVITCHPSFSISPPDSPLSTSLCVGAHGVRPRGEVREPPLQSEVGTTHLVDISGGWEQTWARFTQKGRTATRKAETLGVTILSGKQEPLILDHWEIVSRHFDRWQPDPMPTYAFVSDLAGLESAQIYQAVYQGKKVGTVLVLFYGREVFFWQGARISDPPPGTTNYLYATIFRDAIERDYSSINLGASLGNRQIESFKESLGARKVPYTILKWRHPMISFCKKVFSH
jgi:hypothetical protein